MLNINDNVKYYFNKIYVTVTVATHSLRVRFEAGKVNSLTGSQSVGTIPLFNVSLPLKYFSFYDVLFPH